MTIETAVLKTIGQAINDDANAIKYAGDPDRGRFRGFAALHDLMDANKIVPFSDDYESPDDEFDAFANAVTRETTALIIMMWDRWHAAEHIRAQFETDKGRENE